MSSTQEKLEEILDGIILTNEMDWEVWLHDGSKKKLKDTILALIDSAKQQAVDEYAANLRPAIAQMTEIMSETNTRLEQITDEMVEG